MTAEVLPLRQPEEGWLYIMRDPGRLAFCKVGMTTRDPYTRAAELSTGTPDGLEVAHAWRVPDVRAAERDAHAVLDRWRVSTDTEWFTVSADRAAAALRAFDAQPTTRRRFHWLRLCVEAVGWLTVVVIVAAIIAT